MAIKLLLEAGHRPHHRHLVSVRTLTRACRASDGLDGSISSMVEPILQIEKPETFCPSSVDRQHLRRTLTIRSYCSAKSSVM